MSVISNDLLDIEDKLYETGLLFSATGDPESIVSVNFGEWDCDGEKGPHWIISISSEDPRALSDDEFENISDFVNEKISDASENWPVHVSEQTSDCWGQIVSLNGKQVY
jgi:hypothetical protein